MAKTYEPITTTTLGTAAASITLSSIPNTYTDLKLVINGTTSTTSYIGLQFNGDTATNYSSVYMGTSAPSAQGYSNRASSTSLIYLHNYVASSSTVNHLGTIDIMSYKSTSVYKLVLSHFVNVLVANSNPENDLRCSTWRSTAAITSITIFPNTGNLNAGYTATLYGIKAA